MIEEEGLLKAEVGSKSRSLAEALQEVSVSEPTFWQRDTLSRVNAASECGKFAGSQRERKGELRSTRLSSP